MSHWNVDWVFRSTYGIGTKSWNPWCGEKEVIPRSSFSISTFQLPLVTSSVENTATLSRAKSFSGRIIWKKPCSVAAFSSQCLPPKFKEVSLLDSISTGAELPFVAGSISSSSWVFSDRCFSNCCAYGLAKCGTDLIGFASLVDSAIWWFRMVVRPRHQFHFGLHSDYISINLSSSVPWEAAMFTLWRKSESSASSFIFSTPSWVSIRCYLL